MKLEALIWNGKKKWCWISNPVSVNKNVFSVLAITETFIACSLSIYIIIKFDFWAYLAGWIIITPILLLVSDAASELAIKKLKKKYPLDKKSYREIASTHLKGLFTIIKAF